jgi:hypothetical protein
MTQTDPAATTHSMTELPEGSTLRAVTAVPAEVAGRRALRVELTDAVTLEGKPGVDYVDMPHLRDHSCQLHQRHHRGQHLEPSQRQGTRRLPGAERLWRTVRQNGWVCVGQAVLMAKITR